MKLERNQLARVPRVENPVEMLAAPKVDRLRLSRRGRCGPGSDEYLTPRLWGVADSAPYLHDGRAPSFDSAIVGHDGEGAAARAAFAALPFDEKGPLRVYLMSLRREPRVVVP